MLETKSSIFSRPLKFGDNFSDPLRCDPIGYSVETKDLLLFQWTEDGVGSEGGQFALLLVVVVHSQEVEHVTTLDLLMEVRCVLVQHTKEEGVTMNHAKVGTMNHERDFEEGKASEIIDCNRPNVEIITYP